MTEKKRPSAAAYGQSLKGLGLNLIVKDFERACLFTTEVIGAQLLFKTENFAALRLKGRDFMLHQDETYRGNPLYGLVKAADARGVGVEIHAYETDPDVAEARARQHGFTVLAGSLDKPHGLRECILLDDEGYAWIASIHLKNSL